MTSAADGSHDCYAFGEFRFSPASGELCDGHKTVQLRPQVAKLLDLLLRHAGTTVSREEIRAHLWKGNIVVEFEEGISACVRQLRMALNDGADGARYVQTIARRGYKFVHPVSPVESSRTSLPAVTAVPNQNTAIPAAGRRARFPRAALAGGAIVLAVVLVSVLLASRFHPWAATGRTPRRTTIAVLPFTNVSSHRDLGVI
ncbi:MAG: winged helix-turn-helix domain-containing protein, partial [Gammaproteobacteria bacterium]